MIKTAQAVVNETAQAYAQAFGRITQVGVTADGWILCEAECGAMLFQEPDTGELIPAY